MRFGGVRAVRNVNFTLAEGELRCLIGPNGAGKSTFFKMLTGQLEPTDGQSCSAARDVTAHSPPDRAARHRHQDPGAERVRRPERARKHLARRPAVSHDAARAPTRVVDETLERIGLGGHRGRMVGQLAHGQRQWVELGIVIAAEPELILLDEPAAGMTRRRGPRAPPN